MMDGIIDRENDRTNDGQMDGWNDRQNDRTNNGWIDGWNYGWMEERKEQMMNG